MWGDVGRRQRERPVPGGKMESLQMETGWEAELRGERGAGCQNHPGQEGRNAGGVGQDVGDAQVLGQLQKPLGLSVALM